MNQTTVLIISAGPVGLTLACELARRNISFRIIERSAIPPQGSRAKALQPRSLEILNDPGIAEELMQAGVTELPYRKFNGNQLIGETPGSRQACMIELLEHFSAGKIILPAWFKTPVDSPEIIL